MLSTLLNKLAKFLWPHLKTLMENNQTPAIQPTYSKARLASDAQLGPEAVIDNFAGPAERIDIGSRSYIRGHLLTYGHGGQIKIGQWCYIGARSQIWSMEEIIIGDRVLISHDVNIHDGTAHSLNAKERHEHFKNILEKGHPRESIPGVRSAPIVIEDDVWINFGVTILKGVRIGKGSVIAAGSIITKDVPPGMLYTCKIQPQIIELNS